MKEQRHGQAANAEVSVIAGEDRPAGRSTLALRECPSSAGLDPRNENWLRAGRRRRKENLATGQTSSSMYFSCNRRQKTTKKAVSGIARIMPVMPLSAVPQKKMAMMIAIGWRPVWPPMIFGVST